MPLPVLLDCESADSALASLEVILGMKRSEIETALDSFDLNQVWKRADPRVETDEYIYTRVVGDRNAESAHPVATCWFHLSRVLPDVDFREGILPLHDRTEAIWDSLGRLQRHVAPSEWARFRNDMGPGHWPSVYRQKALGNRVWHGGPFALLVRETAFCAREIANHDYLRGPEIVEDIAFSFKERYGHDLMADYLAASFPCIVKFRDEVFEKQYLYTTLAYLFEKRHGYPFVSRDANLCFNGKGVAVPRERILKIELDPTP